MPRVTRYVLVFGTALVGCQQPIVRPDAGNDVPAADAPPTDTPPTDVPPNPAAPLVYTPAGCDYEVTSSPRVTTFGGGLTTNNRLGDETTFGAAPAPRNVHVNWASDPATTAAVLWSTDAETLATVVQYGTAMDALTRTGHGHRMTASTGENAVHVHEVHLCGLTPDTTYYYRAGGAGHFSDVQRFRTAPAPGATGYDFNFAVAGDSRDNFAIWQQVQERIGAVDAMHQPDFEIFTGDAVAFGTIQGSWESWFAGAAPGMRTMPWLMVHGNHDALAVNYIAQFAQPQANGELYFSLNYGPLHVVVLNDSPAGGDLAGTVMGTERTWLEADLRAVDRARTPWVIVTHHKPAYSSSTHARDADTAVVRAAWPPLFDQYGVDLVFNGHDHDYEVTFPLRGGARAPAGQRGTVYVTAAGAGAELYPSQSSAFTQHSESVVNFAIVHVTERALTLTPYRLDGTVIEPGRAALARP